jgi:hypothetical protein
MIFLQEIEINLKNLKLRNVTENMCVLMSRNRTAVNIFTIAIHKLVTVKN